MVPGTPDIVAMQGKFRRTLAHPCDPGAASSTPQWTYTAGDKHAGHRFSAADWLLHA